MALNSCIHWGCILRVNVDQAIKQDGWKWLLQICNSHNFDGEIFGGHSTDVKSFREWGFRGSEAGFTGLRASWTYIANQSYWTASSTGLIGPISCHPLL